MITGQGVVYSGLRAMVGPGLPLLVISSAWDDELPSVRGDLLLYLIHSEKGSPSMAQQKCGRGIATY